jgi:hypothetical protein
MDVVIFNGKLSITPENLLALVRSFVITYPRQDESGRTTRNYYRAQQVPNSASIHINNDQGEWVGDVLVIPLNPLRSRVAITFNDWESNPREHTWATGWSGFTFDSQKKQMFFELGKYILAIVTSPERAEAWLATAKEQLESLSKTDEPTADKPWEYMSTEPPEEREIVKLLYGGLTDSQIAEQLGVEGHTVSNKLSDIRKKYPHLPLRRNQINRKNRK